METLAFHAETTRLLDIVVHALYTQRDVFLRELIANASDALDRVRFEALRRPELVDASPLEIRLEVNRAERTLTVRDNGIGMTRDEVVNNIGTIARSGTRELIERLRRESDSGPPPDLIGQFGLGFYASFMVADRVTLVTRRAGEPSDSTTAWESEGEGTFRVEAVGEAPRGTAVTLRLKPADTDNGMEDYTNRWVLARIVKQYADFVPYPIVYDGPVEDLEAADASPAASPLVLNSMQPIWTRPSSEIQPAEYTQFYQHIAHDWSEPLLRIAGRAEGHWEYAALVFVPSHAPFDILYHGAEYGLQLYSQRMLIVENCRDVLPRYLRFLKGVVDVGDLPLHVSRQNLQQLHHLGQIRKWLTRKTLEALDGLRRQDPGAYGGFWKEFGRVLKEGVSEDRGNTELLVPLLLFESTADPAALTTIGDYVSRMPSGQRDILYIAGESRAVLERSPHLEEFAGRGYEVLYMTDPVDELLVQALGEVNGHRLRSVAKGPVAIGTEEERERSARELEARTQEFAPLLRFLEARLGAHVRSVRLSQRLTSSPACLSGEEYDTSPHIERLLMRGRAAGPRQRRVLELNPRHPIVVSLLERVRDTPGDVLSPACADVLWGYAALAEGSDLADPVVFNAGVLALLADALGTTVVPAGAAGEDRASA